MNSSQNNLTSIIGVSIYSQSPRLYSYDRKEADSINLSCRHISESG